MGVIPYRLPWSFGLALASNGLYCWSAEFQRLAEGEKTMLWTIAVILLVLWGLGLVTSYTLGGYVHILLVVAVIVVLIRMIQGRKVL
jgi:predicted ferric reductase